MEKILQILLVILISSGLIYGAVMIFRSAFRRSAPPAVSVLLWLIFMARLAVPFTLQVPFHLFTTGPDEANSVPSQAVDRVTPAATLERDSHVLPRDTEIAGHVNPSELLPVESDRESAERRQQERQGDAPGTAMMIMLVLTLGAAIMAARAAARQYRLRRLIRTRGCEPRESVAQAFAHEKTQLGIRSDVRLCVVPGLVTPALALTPRPLVLLPAEMEDHPHVEMALRHELTHYRRKDYLLMLAAEYLQIVWWFNPFAYLAFRAMREDIEAACDEAVVRGCSSECKAIYAGMLIAMSRKQKKASPVLGMSSTTRIEDRIRAVFRSTRRQWSMRSAAVVLAGVLGLTCFTTACQPTPDAAAVGQKEGSEIEDQLAQQATGEAAVQLDAWVDEKEYPTGQTLQIELTPENYGGQNVPVADVQPVVFTQDTAREIAGALFPGDRMTASVRTRQQIAAEIEELKQLQVQAEADPGSVAGRVPLSASNMPQTTAEWDEYAELSPAQQIQMAIDGYQKDYGDAPDASSLRETDYAFTEADDSSQLNIMSENGTALSFVNRDDTGYAEFIYRAASQPMAPNRTLYRNLAPEEVPQDNEYEAARQTAEDFAAKLTNDPMVLQDVTCESAAGSESLQYTFVFVPVIAGYPQPYPADFVGKQSYADGETAQALAVPESITVCVENDRVFRAEWSSPSEYTVVNGNAAVLSFEDAREIALRQFDRLLVPDASNILTLLDDNDLRLTDARLGLTKMLIPGIKEYRLVPCWTFSGNQASDREWLGNTSSTLLGNTIAFVTVNAADGSIVDRGTMS
ncbi:MAG: hypothetical protein HDQ87_09730 [Clostridia bacterium]|nr:hypothetical protein [Clostridia bacterium]